MREVHEIRSKSIKFYGGLFRYWNYHQKGKITLSQAHNLQNFAWVLTLLRAI